MLGNVRIGSKSERGKSEGILSVSVQVFSVIARLNPCNNREEKSITGRSRTKGFGSFFFLWSNVFVKWKGEGDS